MISLAILITVVVCGVVYISHYFRAQLRKYRDINKLPGPSQLELAWKGIGPHSGCEKFQYVCSLNKKYGSVVKLWIKPFDPIVMVTDISLMNKILFSKEHLQKTKMYDVLRPYVGDNIGLTNNVEKWKRYRKICNPAFQLTTVTSFLPIFEKYSEAFLQEIMNEHENPIDIQRRVPLYTLDIIFESLCKQQQDFYKNKNSAFVEAYDSFFSIMSTRLYSIFLSNDLLFSFTKNYKAMNKALNIIKQYTYTLIQSEGARRGNETMDNTRYLIDILFANNVGEESLNDNINGFITAGHDTVAQAICFTMYELSKHPKVQQRLCEEIISVVGKDSDTAVTHGHLQAMTYLEAVIREGMRLHTIVPAIERTSSSDIEFNGVHYPKGTRIMFNIAAIHNSEKYFPNPQTFDPDRFMPDSGYHNQKDALVSFSLGPRDCIGKFFAMLEMKYIIAKCVQKFELIPVKDHSLQLINEIITRSINGIPVIFKERVHT